MRKEVVSRVNLAYSLSSVRLNFFIYKMGLKLHLIRKLSETLQTHFPWSRYSRNVNFLPDRLASWPGVSGLYRPWDFSVPFIPFPLFFHSFSLLSHSLSFFPPFLLSPSFSPFSSLLPSSKQGLSHRNVDPRELPVLRSPGCTGEATRAKSS